MQLPAWSADYAVSIHASHTRSRSNAYNSCNIVPLTQRRHIACQHTAIEGTHWRSVERAILTR